MAARHRRPVRGRRATPRVDLPIIDDGEWAGVPIGGLGTGSIGRTFRGDAARWHLEVGQPPPRAGGRRRVLAVRRRPGRVDERTVLSALRAGRAARRGAGPARRRRDVPRAVPAGVAGRSSRTTLGVRLVGEQLSPVIARDLERSALPVGVVRVVGREPGARPVDGRAPVHLGRPVRGRRVRPRRGRTAVVDADGALAVELRRRRRRRARPRLRGTFAIAALGGDGVELSARVDVRSGRRPRALGRLRRRRAAGARGRAIGGRSAGGSGVGRGGRGDVRCSRPASAGRSGSRSPGTCRSSSSAPAGAGGSATRATGAGPASARCRPRAARPRRGAGLAARRSRPGRRRYLDDPERPDWYAAALFNELYFLVDGGTFWEAGEVGGPEPEPDDIGRFALLECIDYPFYDTVDVDFYASFAIARAVPRAGARAGSATCSRRSRSSDPTIVTIEASGLPAPRKVGGTVPHDVGGPDDDPFYRPNWYRFQDVNDWKDLGPKFVLQVWRDAVAAGPSRRRADRATRWPTVERVLTRPVRARPRRRRPARARRPPRPDVRHLADARAVRVRRARCGWRRVAAAEAMARRLGDDEAADALGGLVRARPGRLRPAAVARRPLRLRRRRRRRARTASWPTSWPASGTRTRPGLGDLMPTATSVATALRTIHALNVVRVRATGGWARSTACGPTARSTSRASSRPEVWVGHDLRAGGVHARPRARRRGLGDRARRRRRSTYERGLWFRTPEAYDRDGNFRASDLPAAAGDLGDRGGAAAAPGPAPAGVATLGRPAPRTGRSGRGPPPAARTTVA